MLFAINLKVDMVHRQGNLSYIVLIFLRDDSVTHCVHESESAMLFVMMNLYDNKQNSSTDNW